VELHFLKIQKYFVFATLLKHWEGLKLSTKDDFKGIVSIILLKNGWKKLQRKQSLSPKK
jgi:hypothetical protein